MQTTREEDCHERIFFSLAYAAAATRLAFPPMHFMTGHSRGHRPKRLGDSEAIRRTLYQEEFPTGHTKIRQIGSPISKEGVQEIAEGEGYDFVEFDGAKYLHFRRPLPAPPSASAVLPDPGRYRTLEAYLADAAPRIQPDVRGRAWLDMTGNELRGDYRAMQAALRRHGWKLLSATSEYGPVYLQLERIDSPTVGRIDPTFIDGPGLGELRQHPVAVRAAEEARRRYGIDALSDEELSRARAGHRRLYRRFGCAFAPTMLFFAVFLFGFVIFNESDDDQVRQLSTNTMIISAVLIGLFALLAWWVWMIRRRTIGAYLKAYEYVVATTLDATTNRVQRRAELLGKGRHLSDHPPKRRWTFRSGT